MTRGETLKSYILCFFFFLEIQIRFFVSKATRNRNEFRYTELFFCARVRCRWVFTISGKETESKKNGNVVWQKIHASSYEKKILWKSLAQCSVNVQVKLSKKNLVKKSAYFWSSEKISKFFFFPEYGIFFQWNGGKSVRVPYPHILKKAARRSRAQNLVLFFVFSSTQQSSKWLENNGHLHLSVKLFVYRGHISYRSKLLFARVFFTRTRFAFHKYLKCDFLAWE